MSKSIVIVGAKRTPMGSFQGCLSPVSATVLGSAAIQGALSHSHLDAGAIDEVYMGCVLAAGLGQAPARQAALGAGLGENVPCTTLNKVCGSGMQAIMLAADQVQLERARVMVAGGMESMSNAPYLLKKARGGYRMGHDQLYDHLFLEGLQDAYSGDSMGIHAQATADEYGLTRTEMDHFAQRSLERAQMAMQAGWFSPEITPVTITSPKGDNTFYSDEPPGRLKPEKIASLKPAFTADGTITAANASSIADGAAALVITREDYAEALQLKPLAKIIDYCSHAQSPSAFTAAPIGAIHTLLERQQLQAADIDRVEINEAFASVPLMAMAAIGFSPEQTNIAGGACALGHPLGASGARIVVTLLHSLIRDNKQRGLAAACIGGGEATAILIERL